MSTRRTETVSFAVTADEKAWLQTQANNSGVRLAQYLREETLRSYRIEQLLRQAREALNALRDRQEYYARTRRAHAAPSRGFCFASTHEAERWVRGFAHASPHEPLKAVVRRACRLAHPDKGGHPADWEKVDVVRRLLLDTR